MGRKDKPISDEYSEGALLRQARQAKGITLTRMAKLIFYSKGHLSSIENGEARVTVQIREKYKEVLESNTSDSQ